MWFLYLGLMRFLLGKQTLNEIYCRAALGKIEHCWPMQAERIDLISQYMLFLSYFFFKFTSKLPEIIDKCSPKNPLDSLDSNVVTSLWLSHLKN